MIGVLLCLVLLPADPPDEVHWRRIVGRQQQLQQVSPTSDRAEAVRLRNELVVQARSYQDLYPGGQRRLDALRLELQTLFEIGTLQEGQFTALLARCKELLRSKQQIYEAEGAYWLMLCQRKAPGDSTVLDRPLQTYQDYRTFCRDYPGSVYTPRLSEVLFAQAEASGQIRELEEIVTRLEQAHPKHLTTELLRGALDLRKGVGQPFFISGVDERGVPIDTRLQRGQVCLVVFWSSSMPADGLVAEIERRRQADGLAVIAIDVRTSQTAENPKPQQWQHLHDQLGPAHRLARRWGIRAVPYVLVIDEGGRLLGGGDLRSWTQLLPSGGARISPGD